MSCQHPGKILLQQYLEPQKISQNKLARAIKVPPRRINEIIHEKRGITADTSVRLAIYFGGSASYWMHLQAEYDLELAREKLGIGLSTIQSLYMDADRLNAEATPATNNTPKKNIKRRMMR